MKRNRLIGIIIAVLILGGIGAGIFFLNNNEVNTDPDTPEDPTIGFEEEVIPLDEMDLPAVVAVINGEEISRDKILQDYHQMKVLYESVGVDTSTPNVLAFMNEALITDLITTTVLAQEAERRGIVISEARLKEEVEKSIDRFPSEAEYKSMLEQLNMTEEAFSKKLERQQKIADVMKELVDEVVESSEELNFTEEDKRRMHAIIDAQLGGIPSYEEIEDTMNEMLEYNKIQVILGDRIQTLIDESEIDLRI
mgnify:CR=1 FL=1|jgi:peptidyl-prolyl cis-trans isomerase SurA